MPRIVRTLFVVLALAAVAPAAASADYSVGIGVKSLTDVLNSDGTYGGNHQKVYLGGFGIAGGDVTVAGQDTGQSTSFANKGRFATGILPYGSNTRAIAISDGTHTPFLIADIEVQGWFAATQQKQGIIDMRRAAAKAINAEAGHQVVDPEHILVQSDHSHGGADAMGVWGGVPFGYEQYMVDQTVAAIKAAYDDMQPGHLFYGTAGGNDILNNQFGDDANNKVMDSDVRVLQARHDDGTPFATFVNFSAHADVLGSGNHNISGDWVSATGPALEKAIPGSKAMVMVGTLGRTQPKRDLAGQTCPGDQSDPTVAKCQIDTYAGQVVARTQQAILNETPIPDGEPVLAKTYLITDPSSNAVLLGLLAAGGPIGAPLNRSLTPPWLTGNVLGTVVGSARIGDVLLTSMPGEAYPQMPLAVRDRLSNTSGDQPRGYMTAGLADDQLGYLIAPFEAYPDPVQQSMFDRDLVETNFVDGDQIDPSPMQACAGNPSVATCPNPKPIGNDNYFFNVSHTLGERVICAALRGADDLFNRGTAPRDSYKTGRCTPFANDLALPDGSDVTLSQDPTSGG
jgi:hypothetical protein